MQKVARKCATFLKSFQKAIHRRVKGLEKGALLSHTISSREFVKQIPSQQVTSSIWLASIGLRRRNPTNKKEIECPQRSNPL